MFVAHRNMRKKEDSRLILDMDVHHIDVFEEFGYYNYTSVQPMLPVHAHKDAVEICYLAKGKQTYFVHEENFEMQGGDLFVTFPNELHGTGENPEEKGALYWLILRHPVTDADYLGLGTEEAMELFSCLRSRPCRLFKGSSRCEYLLQEIIRIYFTDRNLLTRITLNNLLVAFLLEVIRCSRDNSNHVRNQGIASVLRYIEENLSETYSLEDLADRCNLSLSRFKHLFKEEMGVPPTEYINRRKIEKAEILLSDSNLSIKDIAYDLGFSSPAYFATVFRQYKGYAPTQHKCQGRNMKE